jgi:hypothetical protein
MYNKFVKIFTGEICPCPDGHGQGHMDMDVDMGRSRCFSTFFPFDPFFPDFLYRI